MREVGDLQFEMEEYRKLQLEYLLYVFQLSSNLIENIVADVENISSRDISHLFYVWDNFYFIYFLYEVTPNKAASLKVLGITKRR